VRSASAWQIRHPLVGALPAAGQWWVALRIDMEPAWKIWATWRCGIIRARRAVLAKSRSWRAGRCGRCGPMSARRSRCRSWTSLAALSGWVYMGLSCLCGPVGVRLWLVPRSREAGAVTTRAGPQETHRISVGRGCARRCRLRVRVRAALGW
jgi:hypothetical protein